MAENDSTSGEITAAFVNVSDVFTQYSEIPSGGFNVLYKAQRYGKWFVLKGLKPEFRNSAVHLQLLAKEFELGIQMSHPNIVQYYSKEVDPVVGDCIVMEYVDGETLTAFLKKKSTRTPQRAKIAKQLLQAMAYYQGLQVVHRDLKPDNILVSRNGNNVKIIDFGLGDSDTSAILKQPAGSPKYMAPEQVKGDVKIDARADLYSFAQILKLLRISGGGWRRVQRCCGHDNRDKRLVDAAAALALLARRRKWNIGWMVVLLVTLFAAGVLLFLRPVSPLVKPLQGGGEVAAIHDTVVMMDTSQHQGVVRTDTVWKELPPAVITPEMKAFIRADISNYWRPMANLVAQHQGRIDALAAGVAGDATQDMQMYDALLRKYSELCSGAPDNQKRSHQLLKKKIPSASRVPSYDIDLYYGEINNPMIAKYCDLLTKIHLEIGKVDAK